MSGPIVQLRIVTMDNPIEVDTLKVARALEGIITVVAFDLEWATEQEFIDHMNPDMPAYGRHSTANGQWQDEEYQVRWCKAGPMTGFVREYFNDVIDMELTAL